MRNYFLLFVGFLLLTGCGNNDDMVKGPVPFEFPGIFYYPKTLNIPYDNPTTEEGVLLGRYLFYDGRLSGRTHPDSLMSCSTCHLQRNGFDTGFDHQKFISGRPEGLAGLHTAHYTLPLVNLVYNNNGYFWNGLINEGNIESVVRMTIVDPTEINGDIEKTVYIISQIPLYPPMFKAAFGTEEVNMDRISKAIAQFIRTIISNNSKYHQYIENKVELSESEARGLELFFSEEADCFHCHGGLLMSTYGYFNNAKDSVFKDSYDRYSVTGYEKDLGTYRAPSLINCELTGPYMHDGRFESLGEVVDFYSEGLIYSPYADPLMKNVDHKGVQLSPSQKDDLIAFLKTLTDHQLITDPKYSKPSDLD